VSDDPITTVEDAFERFEKNTARVPDDQNAAAKDIHPKLRSAVTESLPGTTHFLSGSYGRKTQATQLKDVDIIVVLDDRDGTFKASASGTLEKVREAITAHELVRTTRISVRAVKAFLVDHEFHVDIVPALRPAAGAGLNLTRNIPDEGYDDWTLEDPEGQLQAAKDKNKDTGGIYIPATRIVKAWNQRYPTSKPLRSYHAEAILWHALSEKTTLNEAVLAFFDKAYQALAPGARTLVPGSQNRYVDDRLKDDERAIAREKVEKTREKAHAAAETKDPAEAMDAWVGVFGTSFPAPSTDPDALAEGLREGTAKAVGAGFAVGSLGERRPIEGRSWSRC
jgi:hypothetical protein